MAVLVCALSLTDDDIDLVERCGVPLKIHRYLLGTYVALAALAAKQNAREMQRPILGRRVNGESATYAPWQPVASPGGKHVRV
jgi:hypothetical protein